MANIYDYLLNKPRLKREPKAFEKAAATSFISTIANTIEEKKKQKELAEKREYDLASNIAEKQFGSPTYYQQREGVDLNGVTPAVKKIWEIYDKLYEKRPMTTTPYQAETLRLRNESLGIARDRLQQQIKRDSRLNSITQKDAQLIDLDRLTRSYRNQANNFMSQYTASVNTGTPNNDLLAEADKYFTQASDGMSAYNSILQNKYNINVSEYEVNPITEEYEPHWYSKEKETRTTGYEIKKKGVAEVSQEKIKVIHPQGQEGLIPRSQLQDAIKQGYRVK